MILVLRAKIILKLLSIAFIYVETLNAQNTTLPPGDSNREKIKLNTKLFNILLWTSQRTPPFNELSTGQKTFLDHKCSYTNCYITSNAAYLNDMVYMYDVILFNAADLGVNPTKNLLPPRRSRHQRYVLVSAAAAAHAPVTADFNDVFNWTWTYKLDSDIVWSSFVVRNAREQVVGPTRDMRWIDVNQTRENQTSLGRELARKTKAAVWVVSSNDSFIRHKPFVDLLNKHLRNYNHSVDVIYKFDMKFTTRKQNSLYRADFLSAYYFYLAFEDTLDEDYVTNTLLLGQQHYIVPIVYGGADYSRLLPAGVYLDAFSLGPRRTARAMVRLIRSSAQYHAVAAGWRHYRAGHAQREHDERDAHSACRLCALLNEPPAPAASRTTRYRNIVAWFNGRNNWYLKKFETKSIRIVNRRDLKYALNSKVCKHGPPIVIAVVHSAIEHYVNRQALRQTWGQPTDFLKMVFFLGQTDDKHLTADIVKEHADYGDIVQGNFLDTYRNLTYKALMALKWVTLYCPRAEYIVKTDDDMFVHLHELRALLAQRPPLHPSITCDVWQEQLVSRVTSSLHYVREQDFPRHLYPSLCMGAFVLYNPKVVPRLIIAANAKGYISTDDAFITGIIRSELKIPLGHVRHLLLSDANMIEIVDGEISKMSGIPTFLFGPYNIAVSDLYLLWNQTEEFHRKYEQRKSYTEPRNFTIPLLY